LINLIHQLSIQINKGRIIELFSGLKKGGFSDGLTRFLWFISGVKKLIQFGLIGMFSEV